MCYRSDYLEKQLVDNEHIYIDACSLMNSNRLDAFLENAGPYLQKNEKRIRIPGVVLSELEKLKNNDDYRKSQRAKAALQLIRDKENYFIIDDDYVDDPFADQELLIELIKGRSSSKQLLISNDKALTTDAYKLNYLESFGGRKISVCYLTSDGYLQMSDCVKATLLAYESNTYKTQEEKIIVKKVYIEKEPSRFIKFGAPAIALISGIAIGAYGNKVFEYVKTIDRRMKLCY